MYCELRVRYEYTTYRAIAKGCFRVNNIREAVHIMCNGFGVRRTVTRVRDYIILYRVTG